MKKQQSSFLKIILKISALLVFVAFFIPSPLAAIAGDLHQILHIVDGYTIDIDYKGTKERVRLLCVNIPESVHPDKKQNIAMGAVASDYTKKRLSGKSVRIELEGKLRGNYGRLLAYVFIDNENFDLDLVRQGLSPYYTKYG